MTPHFFYKHLCAGRFDKVHNAIAQQRINIDEFASYCATHGALDFSAIAHNSARRLEDIRYNSDTIMDLEVSRLRVLRFVLQNKLVHTVSAQQFLRGVLREETGQVYYRVGDPEQQHVASLLHEAFVDTTLGVEGATDSDMLWAYQHMLQGYCNQPLEWLFKQDVFHALLSTISPQRLYNSIAACTTSSNTVDINVLFADLIANPHYASVLGNTNFSCGSIVGDFKTFEYIATHFPDKIKAWTETQRNSIPFVVANLIQNFFAVPLARKLLAYSDPNIGNEAFVGKLNSLKLNVYSLDSTNMFLTIVAQRPNLLAMPTAYTKNGAALTVYDLCFHKSCIAHFYNDTDRRAFEQTINTLEITRQKQLLEGCVTGSHATRKAKM